jgi:hypothetical protein
VRNLRASIALLLALLAANCASDPAEVTGSIPKQAAAPKPLLPAPPPAVLPDKPRSLAEPECRSLVSQISACSGRFKDKEKKESYRRRAIEVAETLGSMEAGQRKATCKADLPVWRKDCGVP